MKERLELLKEIGERFARKKQELVEAFARDIGVSVKIGRAEVDMTADYLKTMDEEIPWVEGKKPYGTVGAILPYDASTMMFARMAGAALLGRNRVALSFSSLVPTVREIVCDMLNDIDIIEINREMDNRSFSNYCCTREDIRLFFISGGKEVGRLFEERKEFFDKIIFAGPSGLPPCLVLPGSDVEYVGHFVARRALLNGGQYCTTIKRVYIEKSLFDDFMHYLLKEVDNIKVGDPMDPEVDYGPIKAKRTRVLFERALNRIKGEVLRGGFIDGEWIPPTVVLTKEPIPDLELFGPYLAVKPFDSREEALKEVCSTRYGHIVYVFGHVEPGEKRFLEENYGMVKYEMKSLFLPLRGPYGGKKDAGWVLEKREEGYIKRDGAIIYAEEMVQ